MQTCLQQGTHLELTYHSINVKIEKLYSMHYREDTNVALQSVSPLILIRIDAVAMHVLCYVVDRISNNGCIRFCFA